jgi:hypothetical protein
MNNEIGMARLTRWRHKSNSLHGHLSLPHALRVKSAEYWLRLGEADQAIRELEDLPKTAWDHQAAVKVRVAALDALGQKTGAIVQS